MNLLLVIPTYNERENLAGLLEGFMSRIEGSVLIVDDNSRDGTGALADTWHAEFPGRVHVLHRPGKLGLATAYLNGWQWAIKAARYDVIGQMDADGSHLWEDLVQMLKWVDQAELVIGSRYIRGAKISHWPYSRRVLSQVGNYYAQRVLGLPVHDLTGGLKLWRTTLLERIIADPFRMMGYGFQVETTLRALVYGANVREVPIHFVNRQYGESKMSWGIVKEAGTGVWKLRHWKRLQEIGVGQSIQLEK